MGFKKKLIRNFVLTAILVFYSPYPVIRYPYQWGCTKDNSPLFCNRFTVVLNIVFRTIQFSKPRLCAMEYRKWSKY